MSIHLGYVLNLSSTGIIILQYYKSTQKLNDGIKVMLVDTIINWVITKKIHISVCLADQLANQVGSQQQQGKSTFFRKSVFDCSECAVSSRSMLYKNKVGPIVVNGDNVQMDLPRLIFYGQKQDKSGLILVIL